MDWVEEYGGRLALAYEALQLIDAIPAALIRNEHALLGRRADEWFVRALELNWGNPDLKESVTTCRQYVREQIHSQPNMVSTHLDCAANAIKTDGGRFVPSIGERERRYLFVDLVRRIAPTFNLTEAEAQGLFRGDPTLVEGWFDWALSEGLVKEAGATIGDGRWVAITSHGREWLDDQRESFVTRAAARRGPAGSSLDVDLSFLHDPDQRSILQAMLVEMGTAVAAGLPMASIVLAGAISEGILYDALVARKAAAMASPKAPRLKGAAKLPKDIDSDGYEHEWTLRDLIDVARDIGVIGENAGRMAHDVLRDFRNMIHPKKQAKSGRRPGAPEMKGCVAWLEALARDVAEASP